MRIRRQAAVVVGMLIVLMTSVLSGSGSASPAAPSTESAVAPGMDVEALTAEPGWAGAWLDAEGRTHINVKRTTKAAAATVRTGLLRTEVARALTDLDAIHHRASTALTVAGLDGHTDVRVDVARNGVRVGATPKALNRAVAVLQGIAGVTVESDSTADGVAAPAACVDRRNCGVPIRGGVQITSPRFTCSAGFSASGSDGSRWLMSAGHCGVTDETFRHGGETYGPVRQYRNAFAEGKWYDGSLGRYVWLDFLRIRLDNPYWRSLPGGYLYATPSSTVDVKSALTPEALTVGQTICRSSYSDYHAESAENCGTVVSYNNQDNAIEVSGMVMCVGDSGGAVYAQVAGGGRRAVGFISGFYYPSDPAPKCRPAGYNGLISGLTWAYHFMDTYSNATIRVDTR